MRKQSNLSEISSNPRQQHQQPYNDPLLAPEPATHQSFLLDTRLQESVLPLNNSRLKVQLFISCRDLVNLDYVGKTDPLVALYTKSDQKKGKWSKTDCTEVMPNNLNPDFQKSFILYYYFEKH